MPISRVMNWPDDVIPPDVVLLAKQEGEVGAQAQGGGNLNGSQNTAHLAGHAGTGADRVSLPRMFRANYCGVV